MSEWSAAWVKLLHYVMRNDRMPACLKELDIEVPKKFAYMINGFGSGAADPRTKAEAFSPLRPGVAAKASKGQAPTTVSPMNLVSIRSPETAESKSVSLLPAGVEVYIVESLVNIDAVATHSTESRSKS